MSHFSESCRNIIVLDFECFTGNRELKLHLDFMQIPNDPGPHNHTPLPIPIYTFRCFSLCIVSHFCSDKISVIFAVPTVLTKDLMQISVQQKGPDSLRIDLSHS